MLSRWLLDTSAVAAQITPVKSGTLYDIEPFDRVEAMVDLQNNRFKSRGASPLPRKVRGHRGGG